MTPIIQVHKISKRYVIENNKAQYSTFRDAVAASTRGLYDRFLKGKKIKSEKAFWALKDVSFDVNKGDVVGVIGSNGAGKSTLLKILSQITPPSNGKAIIRGRVGSLLEVGTGFHPELTGRENIYLNGAILGMRSREINSKFDKIVEFSGVSKFLDTPVKFFSSGMYTRLAFSVAAFFEPEVLLVDEVLSVGDAEFQKRSLGKMESIAKNEGRTILFVSHNLASIENLCNKCILLEDGRITSSGQVGKVITHYLSKLNLNKGIEVGRIKDRRGSGEVRFTSYKLLSLTGKELDHVRSGQDFDLVLGFSKKVRHPLGKVSVSFAITDKMGRSIILHRTNFTGQDFNALPMSGEFRCRISKLPLVKGIYNIGIYLDEQNKVLDDPGIISELVVEHGDFFGSGNPGLPQHSPVLIKGDWSLVTK